MQTKTPAFLVLCLIIIASLLSACGGNTAPVATPLPSTPTPVTTPAWTGPTVTPGGPFPIGIYEPVRFFETNKFEFLADGTYTAYLSQIQFLAKGTYVVDGNEIVFNEEKICLGRPGRYIWSFDGKSLVFTVVEDECLVPRKVDLQRQWIKQP